MRDTGFPGGKEFCRMEIFFGIYCSTLLSWNLAVIFDLHAFLWIASVPEIILFLNVVFN